MASQIHRRFADDQVRLILDLYINKAITLQQLLQQLATITMGNGVIYKKAALDS